MLHACSHNSLLPLLQAFTLIPSNPDDPLGLTTTNAALLRSCRPGPTTLAAASLRNVITLSVKIRIERFYAYHVINTVMPVSCLSCAY